MTIYSFVYSYDPKAPDPEPAGGVCCAWLGCAGTVRPCSLFVVAGAGFQAAVQDVDQPLAKLAQRGVARLAPGPGPQLVVVGPGARWAFSAQNAHRWRASASLSLRA